MEVKATSLYFWRHLLLHRILVSCLHQEVRCLAAALLLCS